MSNDNNVVNFGRPSDPVQALKMLEQYIISNFAELRAAATIISIGQRAFKNLLVDKGLTTQEEFETYYIKEIELNTRAGEVLNKATNTREALQMAKDTDVPLELINAFRMIIDDNSLSEDNKIALAEEFGIRDVAVYINANKTQPTETTEDNKE